MKELTVNPNCGKILIGILKSILLQNQITIIPQVVIVRFENNALTLSISDVPENKK